ncbi:MAG: polysaccharide biosynthesis protein GumN [Proteobacteria bacterium SG_bin5]|nr:TraB/GumN family protein [Sphingomonas sp.]OQW38826.1 MAG: polysaccharide biosynthesis protein GumN [Proteobacteria bacterium SG_bin5]
MRLRDVIGAPLALALMLVAPARAQTPTAAPAPAPAATQDADPALWVVKDADTTIYLFGTVHVLKPGLSWFDEAVKKAFDDSKELVLELPDLDQAAIQQAVLARAPDKSGTPLSAKLPEAERPLYSKAIADYAAPVGLTEPVMDRFKPWFAAITLTQLPLAKLGYDPSSGAEKVLTAAAKAANKPISGLETIDQQLGYFDTLPEPQQIKFLELTLKELPKEGETLDKMVKQWAAGDPEALGATINEGLREQPEIGAVLLTERNKRWASWIADRMKQPGVVFVAVGAGHLAGKDSVQNQLTPYKITATRVNY